mmetsp:Transcript_38492/g.81641  ORF Transcript_38492/g.81641 Transcript_38492/m.81641 type:complete len:208 (-) Transcript_38492:196-819(-)
MPLHPQQQKLATQAAPCSVKQMLRRTQQPKARDHWRSGWGAKTVALQRCKTIGRSLASSSKEMTTTTTSQKRKRRSARALQYPLLPRTALEQQLPHLAWAGTPLPLSLCWQRPPRSSSDLPVVPEDSLPCSAVTLPLPLPLPLPLSLLAVVLQNQQHHLLKSAAEVLAESPRRKNRETSSGSGEVPAPLHLRQPQRLPIACPTGMSQ